ncbi:hypothetical protein M9H77_03540 [Catharanthus roseus]|uniref:Uncharacterized protein n=1 Tax=Catharanthus roseus TaxID=4058 RepID=A0ACC0CBI3_CATRO|nr:hypothetical protein M9H77_03540 [Catharanthus roseus]
MGIRSPPMTQAPSIPASTTAPLHLSADSITYSTDNIGPTYYLRAVYLTVVCSCSYRDGSSGSKYDSSELAASTPRFSGVIIFAYKPGGQGGRGAEKHTGGSILFTEIIVKWQKDLTKKFSRSKYLEELQKHQKREKKGEYVDFRSVEFWEKFHGLRRIAEEDAEAPVTAMPDDL